MGTSSAMFQRTEENCFVIIRFQIFFWKEEVVLEVEDLALVAASAPELEMKVTKHQGTVDGSTLMFSFLALLTV